MPLTKKTKLAIALTIRQILGATTSGILWWVDVENKISSHPFPIITYVIPMGIALGWDFKKIVITISKGTKFEGILEEDIDIPTKILHSAIKKGIPPSTIKHAIESGLSDENLLDLIENNAKELKILYKNEILND